MTTPILRRVEPAEAETYQRLVHAAYRQATELGVDFAAATADLDHVTRHLTQNVAYGYDVDGRLAVTASIRFPWGPNPGPFPLPHFGWVAVDPALARQGWSRRVMADVEAVLRDDLHVPAVTLGTADDHSWLADHYRRLGYRDVGTKDLGLGHLTRYLLKPLSEAGFSRFLDQHPHLKEHS